MAPNYHPEFHRAMANNSRAFYKKTGMSAQHLDNAKNAVTRKSNEMLEKTRMRQAGRASSGRPSNVHKNHQQYLTAGTSAVRI